MSQHPSHLPRLGPEWYRGNAIVHWTTTTLNRAVGWLDEPFHASFRELMLHAAAREGLLCPVYCLMPDHFHLVWIGLRPDSDQRNAMAFLRTHLKPSLAPHHQLQPQAYDHVLREEDRQPEAFAAVCDYVLANPERKQLVSRWQDWPFCGAVLPGYPTLHPARDDYWEKFWKLSAQLREEIT